MAKRTMAALNKDFLFTNFDLKVQGRSSFRDLVLAEARKGLRYNRGIKGGLRQFPAKHFSTSP